jgi:gliding motility-associated-like protein/uncharacterized repeat protein (TIGR01451 family)
MKNKTTLNVLLRGCVVFCIVFLSQIASSQVCPDINQRVYATNQNWSSNLLGSVSNPTAAIDGDPTTHSTINTGLVLVGLGTTYQNLSWGGADIAAGTPLSVKLGANTNLLSVGSTILIQARRDGANVGSSQVVTGNVLNLISGESVYDYTFIPEAGGVPQPYDEVRITITAAVGLGFSINVFEAYYHTTTQVADCNLGDVVDLFYGVEDLGVGLLTGAAGVDNPWNAIDGDDTTYASLVNGISLLAEAKLTVAFSTPLTAQDKIEILLSDDSIALSIEAMNGLTVQRYYGNNLVGLPLSPDGNGLTVDFLGFSDSQAIALIEPQDGLTYDRIEIAFGGVADLLDGLRIHEIRRKAGFSITGYPYNIVHLNPGDSTTLTINDPTGCTTYQVVDEDGNPLAMSGNTFELPAGLAEGTIYSYYIQGFRYGCAFGEPTEIAVLVGDTTNTGICPGVNERVYATNQTWGTSFIGPNVSNAGAAVDGDPQTYSTINIPLGLLGLGTTYQDFSWGGAVLPAGTPVSVKLGPGANLVGLGSGLTIVGRRNGANIGIIQSVDGALLNLISGENAYEYTFVPSSGGVPQEYDEIRVMFGGTLSLGQSVRIFEVYYHTQSDTIADCNAGEIIDLFYGVEDLGIGALTGLVGVSNPWNVADNDPDTYAAFSNTLSVLAQSTLTAVFASPLQGADQVEIQVSSPSTPLSTTTLNGLTIQRFMGSQLVGGAVETHSSTVSVEFLGNSDNEMKIILAPDDGLVYDRVKLSYGGVADLLGDLRVHEISRRAGFQIEGAQGNVIYWETGDSTSINIQEPTTCTTFQVTDEDNNPLAMSGNTFELPSNMVEGQTYYFYVQPYRYGCAFGKTVQIVVVAGDYSVDPTDCPEAFERTYATNQTWGTTLLGGIVSNGGNAVDGDPSTHSTITVALGLLGLGDTYQDISWGGTVVPAGTPVSIKLGPEYGVLGLASGLSVVARKDGANIGAAQNVDSALLSLLPGENVYEYTFIPSLGGVPQEYDEIRITLGGLVAAGVSARIFEVYYLTPTDTVANCGTGDVLDLFYGVEDLGIQALTATVGVANAWDSVDGDVATYATIYNGAAVLADAHMTVIFSTPTIDGDTVEMLISNPGGLLSLGLLEGFEIQRYYGADPVGDPIDSASSFLQLNLLNPGDNQGTLVLAPEDGLAYDRIKISMGGVANVLDGLRIHEITRTPFIKLTGSNDMEIVPCAYDLLSFDPVDTCTTYQVQDDMGNLLTPNGDYAFDLPAGLIEGNTYTFFVQAIRYGCNIGGLQEIEVTIMQRATEADLTDILVNGEPAAPICLGLNEEVELTVSLAPTSTVVNPVFVWYDEDGNLITGGEDGTLGLGYLTAGTYTYSVAVRGDNFCENAPTDRKEVTFIVSRAGEPTDITIDGDGDQICFTDSITFTPSTTTVVNPLFTWYLTNDTTSPIADGDINGSVTYNIDATGALTVSGLAPGSTTTYYVAVSGDEVCENENNNLAEASVTVYDVDSPTTTNSNQVFCLVDNPTVGDIDVNEPGVVWYDAPTGGTAYDLTDALITGIYYGVLISPEGCESSERLEVTITVGDADTPTTPEPTQIFCLADEPTVSDILVNETGVIWYDAPIGGTAYDPTASLTDGEYYGVLVSAEGCESSVRLQVIVIIKDTPTPTTSDTTQNFCVVDNPTVADIDVNETGVIWYDAETGGNTYASTAPLTTGTYYGVLVSPEGCESSVRLEVSVTVTDAETPTTSDTTQNFCAVNNPTVADIVVNETDVIWYDAPMGGTAYVATDALTTGNYYGVLVSAEGCESSVRLEVMITVDDADTPTTSNTTQDFCAVENPTVADIAVNETGVIWYNAPTGGTAYAPTDALTTGNYYGVLVTPEGCESSVRLEVVVTVGDAGTPTTIDTAQEFCLADNPTVADINVNETGVIWYDAPTGGNVYDPTDILATGTYYGAIVLGGCESSTRLEVNITVYDNPTPTGEAEQVFCVIDQPTVANIIVNEPGVIWYDAPTGGTPYLPADLLIDGATYYGTIIATGGCESSTRLAVTVSLTEAQTPTTNETNQNFCLVDNPTIGDIVVNEPGVIWYDAPTGGTAFNNAVALEDGMTYYGTLITAEGCESTTRLAVTVAIHDADTPTTSDTTQDFCVVDNPVVGDIEVNEADVIWYNAPTGGTAYAATDALENGTYYGVLVSPEGCESSIRLEVIITVNEGGPTNLTTDHTGEICLDDVITYTTDEGQSNYQWEVVGGQIVSGGTTQDNSVDILWTETGTNYVAVAYDPSNGCYLGDVAMLTQEVVVCADIDITKEADNLTPMIGENVTFTITVTNSGPNDFEDVVVSEVIQSGFLFISSDATLGDYNSLTGVWQIDVLPANETAVLTIVVQVLRNGDYVNTVRVTNSTPIDKDPNNNEAIVVLEPICLFVFNEFSPNGDGVNETLVISCIEEYPNNEIKIFDKYGSMVFKQKGYDNNWNGVANVGGVSKGEVLPSDTYYYVLDLGDGSKAKTGWLFIIK